MLSILEKYVVIFLIYSFLGWLIESLRSIPREGKFINRGFCIGPYCPIYGVGSILITILLEKYKRNVILVFVLSVFISAILEYLISFIMEKIFKTRWWDYSDRKININGRICIENLISFGIASLIVIYITNPLLAELINQIPKRILNIVTILYLLIFMIDFVISIKTIFNLTRIKRYVGDGTKNISEDVIKIIRKKLRRYKRLAEAFPNIKDEIKYNKWNTEKNKH